jgi:PPOX class probable F420-dependent enzyme
VTARLSDDACRLVDAPNFAHLATLMPDGAPKVEPVWVMREGDHLLVTTDANSIKARNADGDPRVALSITDFDDPYAQLLVRGRVVEVRDDLELEVLDAFSEQYLGGPFARRRWSQRVVLVIAPETVRYAHSPLRDPRTSDRTRLDPPGARS